MSSDTIGSDVTKMTTKNVTNELFVDVVETMKVTFNSSGNVINSEIDGKIQMKSYMAGNPIFKMSLCDNIVLNSNQDYGIKLDDVNYDPCVNYENFEFNKTLSIKPPNGTFVAMNYRITKDFNYPFRVHSFLNEKSAFKVELVIKVTYFIYIFKFIFHFIFSLYFYIIVIFLYFSIIVIFFYNCYIIFFIIFLLYFSLSNFSNIIFFYYFFLFLLIF